jgi:hypothetical protein
MSVGSRRLLAKQDIVLSPLSSPQGLEGPLRWKITAFS